MFSTLRGATWGLSCLFISQVRHCQVSKEKHFGRQTEASKKPFVGSTWECATAGQSQNRYSKDKANTPSCIQLLAASELIINNRH